jgi:NADH-quinone oxidoreductase subunit G
MPKAKVNGVEIEFENGMTVLQVAELAGEEIPRFCYHERLSIAGNCRMCLVEVKPGPPKPQASCALPAADGQEILTHSDMVLKARQGVMEFLLINHPLDCPICDQGGECDLQDQAMGYGRDTTRYEENKRAVEEKYMGPLIKTVMTRCIQCTRCVRFVTEVAGVSEIGLISRGEDVEITTYLGRAVTSEISANIIDLCPVGALTSKPYSFHARRWELSKTETIDVMDALGSAIRMDCRGSAVMRVLPRTNDDVNEEWISDKTRFACDGLSRQRLDRPMIRREGRLREVSWGEAFSSVAARLLSLPAERVGVIAGDLQDVESMKAALDLFTGWGTPHVDCRQDGSPWTATPRESWLFNSTLSGIEAADAILLVGSNPRLEAAVFNARLRKMWLRGGVEFALLGPRADLGYDYEWLGETYADLARLDDPKSKFGERLRAARTPAFIIGQGAVCRPDGASGLRTLAQAGARYGLVRDGWNGWNILHTAAARVGALELGFLPREGGLSASEMVKPRALDLLFLLGADEIDLAASDAFKVYIGSHGDAGAHRADVILPGAAYSEKDALYVNTEGRVQKAFRAVDPKGEAREDWAILRALSGYMNRPLPYDTLEQLRARLFADHPRLGRIGYVASGGELPVDMTSWGAEGVPSAAPLRSTIRDHYLTNPIARASVTMAECQALASGQALAAE